MPNRALFSGPPGGRGDRRSGSTGRSAPAHCACEIKPARGRPERHLEGIRQMAPVRDIETSESLESDAAGTTGEREELPDASRHLPFATTTSES